MEEQWYADRCRLREVLRAYPDWSKRQVAEHLGRSLGWVKKWRRRLRDGPAGDDRVLRGHSRARRHPPPRIGDVVVARILAIRDHPPEQLQRIPGPRAILYYLHRDADLVAGGERLPRSTRTVWQILARHGRIAHPPARRHEPLDRPPPLAAWQVDFKDVTTVPVDPEGKQQHGVEALNAIDVGTSILLGAQVRADFTAETALAGVLDLLRQHGRPERITIDRDPRFVGSHTGRDFPGPFIRCLACLGVAVDVCPPRRPDKNGFVERYHRTYERECLKTQRPGTQQEAAAATAAFVRHYNEERPNQALSCGNRPPRVAYPAPPPRPPLPDRVDPDGWLRLVDGRHYVRKVRANGTVRLDEDVYYVQQHFAGQYVTLQIDAAGRTLVVQHRQQSVKRIPLKGLHAADLPLDDDVAEMRRQARSWRARRRYPDAAEAA